MERSRFTSRDVPAAPSCVCQKASCASAAYVLMGDYQGARLYMRTDDAGDWKGRDMLIGLTSGLPRGFTLEAGSGYRFVLHPSPAQGSAGPR